MKKQVRIGFLGMGMRGRDWLKFWPRIKNAKVVAICERYDFLLKKAYAESGDPEIQCYSDFTKMLKEANIDAVGVITGADTQAALICQALEAGKHVISEVPLTYSLEDCWKLVLTVEKTGMKYLFGEQVRYWPFVSAWKKMVREGMLGKIVFAEGQYLGYYPTLFWTDRETGDYLTIEQARNNPRAEKAWRNGKHQIIYLPHELSPILSILDDRVTKVACMGTRPQSYVHPEIMCPDVEVAVMHTEKDTVMKLACGFTVPRGCPHHWFHLLGTKGAVETGRTGHTGLHDGKMWFADSWMADVSEVKWGWDLLKMPPEAIGCGHDNSDYFPASAFIECILNDTPPPMDIYKAVETAAPAIIAAMSAEQGGRCMDVPDFRPGPHRAPGKIAV